MNEEDEEFYDCDEYLYDNAHLPEEEDIEPFDLGGCECVDWR